MRAKGEIAHIAYNDSIRFGVDIKVVTVAVIFSPLY